jgi:hypothetical protein
LRDRAIGALERGVHATVDDALAPFGEAATALDAGVADPAQRARAAVVGVDD